MLEKNMWKDASLFLLTKATTDINSNMYNIRDDKLFKVNYVKEIKRCRRHPIETRTYA